MTGLTADKTLPAAPAWIGVDWSASALRAWALDADGRVLATASSAQGMGTLKPAEFQPVLLGLIEPWLPRPTAPPVDVIACGMVGARQGWRESPYRAVPCAPVAGDLTHVKSTDPRISVAIVPGLSQAQPADVMRGEETRIAGYLAAHPGFDGVLCLPGTHTRWAHVSAGEVVSFQTCMTGELFALLGTGSVLRDAVESDEIDPAAFRPAVVDALTAPQKITARLFGIRAETLLSDLSPQTARARLSGLLIGVELAGTRPYWLGQEVAIIGTGRLATLYASALSETGIDARVVDATESTLAGLGAARALAEA